MIIGIHGVFVGDTLAGFDPETIQSSVVIVEGDKGSGSAFAVEEGGKQFLYTSAHVLSGQKNVIFKDANGKEIKVTGQIDVADDQDLARLPLTGELFKTPLTLIADANVKIGEEVVAYGNSGGESVITYLKGEVLGVGPEEIEVDAGIIPGNSGGPILRQDSKEVLAIASRAQAESGPWAAETRFEGIRRFGLRPPKTVKWKRTSLKAIQREWEQIRQTNIDTISIVAVSILAATQRGLYIPDDLIVGANGKVAVRSNSAANPNRRRSAGGTSTTPESQPAGQTYVVKEWLSKHRRNGVTRTIWGSLSKLNKALGYGSNRPLRSMVEVKRHYGTFFKPLFAANDRDIRPHPKSFSNVHRADYEMAVAARKKANKFLIDFAKRIKSGIFQTGRAGN